MKIVLLTGFFILTLFMPHFVNAQYSQDPFQNKSESFGDQMREIDRTITNIAKSMIEQGLSDEEIDEELSTSIISNVDRESIVKKLKELGSDYNGQYITSYNE